MFTVFFRCLVVGSVSQVWRGKFFAFACKITSCEARSALRSDSGCKYCFSTLPISANDKGRVAQLIRTGCMIVIIRHNLSLIHVEWRNS